MKPKSAVNKPFHVFIITFCVSIIAILFAHQLFPDQSSILSILLITMIFVPFFQKLFVIEEKKEDECLSSPIIRKTEGNIFERHADVIIIFSAFFMGIIFSMSFVYVFMPQYAAVFKLQTQTLAGFSQQSSGSFLDVLSSNFMVHNNDILTGSPTEMMINSSEYLSTGHVTASSNNMENFWKFFWNNTQVMMLMFILSVLFGAGAVFILSWNASVIGVYVGVVVKSITMEGMGSAAAYFFGVPLGLSMIVLHGVPEISAYFFAGLGGCILSVGFVREKLNTPEFRNIFKDSLIFLVTAEVLIFVAAMIEAFV